MELMFAWFWLVKLGVVFITLYVMYIAFVKHKFKNKLYNILAGISILLMFISPIKMVPTTVKVNNVQNAQIEQNKVLPEKVVDDSFKASTNIVGITDNDLK